MSIKKTIAETYSYDEKISNNSQKPNLDDIYPKKSKNSGNFKRKKSFKKLRIISCANCKKEKEVKEFIKLKNKKDLIKKIQSITIDNNKNIPLLIQGIKQKIKKTKNLCKECFKDIIKNEDFLDKIKKLLFIKKRKKFKKNLSNCKNNIDLGIDNNEKDYKNKNKENDNTIINKSNFFFIESVEYEECFKNIVQYLKLALFEVSFFVQSFNLYINSSFYINNISQNNFNIKFFFHSYIQTRIKLENLYVLINKVVIKYQNITNRIISKLNMINTCNNEDFKTNYDNFIYFTNLILANLSCFINNLNICLNVLRYSNNIIN